MRKLVTYDRDRKPTQYVVYESGWVVIVTCNPLVARKYMND